MKKHWKILTPIAIVLCTIIGGTTYYQVSNAAAPTLEAAEVVEKPDYYSLIEKEREQQITTEVQQAKDAQFQAKVNETKAAIKAEEERLAKEAEEKRLAKEAEEKRLAKEAEEKRLAEEARVKEEARLAAIAKAADQQSVAAQQAETSSVETASVTTSTTKPATSSKPAETKTEQSTAKQESVPTSGFSFAGQTFGIRSFSGSGFVPSETNYVYQWTAKPSHYLVERISPAGRIINSLGVGSKVTVNGRTYTVTSVKYNIPNDHAASKLVFSVTNGISFQTCTTTKGDNGKSHVNIWFAQ